MKQSTEVRLVVYGCHVGVTNTIQEDFIIDEWIVILLRVYEHVPENHKYLGRYVYTNLHVQPSLIIAYMYVCTYFTYVLSI